ncbi:hypothetical protein [Serratia symbiotica]|uniref:Uncharacterized protein n=1 Tax=Serratia symbiotica TaxID=138074 RepID=A0A7D5SS32_9GAMM|nr:hypothetical protein [Serratia symbiotica]QLH62278.1 hypothetical protein SYMBAF_04050 [Serratia symbiotica]
MITVITTSSKWLWWCGELAVALVLAVSHIQPTTPQNHLVLVSYTGRRIPVIFKERLKQSRLVNPLWFNAWFTSPPQAAVVSWKLSHNQEGNLMSVNQLPPGLDKLIIDLEEENASIRRFLIGLLETLTTEQRLKLTDTIFELNQTAESSIPQNKPRLLKRAKSISRRTVALLDNSKPG